MLVAGELIYQIKSQAWTDAEDLADSEAELPKRS